MSGGGGGVGNNVGCAFCGEVFGVGGWCEGCGGGEDAGGAVGCVSGGACVTRNCTGKVAGSAKESNGIVVKCSNMVKEVYTRHVKHPSTDAALHVHLGDMHADVPDRYRVHLSSTLDLAILRELCECHAITCPYPIVISHGRRHKVCA